MSDFLTKIARRALNPSAPGTRLKALSTVIQPDFAEYSSEGVVTKVSPQEPGTETGPAPEATRSPVLEAERPVSGENPIVEKIGSIHPHSDLEPLQQQPALPEVPEGTQSNEGPTLQAQSSFARVDPESLPALPGLLPDKTLATGKGESKDAGLPITVPPSSLSPAQAGSVLSEPLPEDKAHKQPILPSHAQDLKEAHDDPTAVLPIPDHPKPVLQRSPQTASRHMPWLLPDLGSSPQSATLKRTLVPAPYSPASIFNRRQGQMESASQARPLANTTRDSHLEPLPVEMELPALSGRESQVPTVRVTIGRIEVKAAPPAPQPLPTTQAEPARPEPVVSLQDYLQRRRERGR